MDGAEFMKKWAVLSAIITIGILSGFFYLQPAQEVCIHYSETGIPFVKGKIQKHPIQLSLDLSGGIPLFLTKNTLNQVQKRHQGFLFLFNRFDEEKKASYYKLDGLKIGNWKSNVMIAVESNPEAEKVFFRELDGKIRKKEKGPCECLGRAFIHSTNLYLDFIHSKLILVDKMEELFSTEEIEKAFFKVPLLEKKGVYFRAKTDHGYYNFQIDTQEPHSWILTSEEREIKKDIFLKIFLDQDHVEEICVHSTTVSKTYSDEDIVLGMDFLKNRALFLDYHNKIAFFKKK